MVKKYSSSRNKTPNAPVMSRSPCHARVSGTGFFKTKPRCNHKNPEAGSHWSSFCTPTYTPLTRSTAALYQPHQNCMARSGQMYRVQRGVHAPIYSRQLPRFSFIPTFQVMLVYALQSPTVQQYHELQEIHRNRYSLIFVGIHR